MLYVVSYYKSHGAVVGPRGGCGGCGPGDGISLMLYTLFLLVKALRTH